jgi:quercetin dioxygenase-like cupin family protein
MDRAFFPDGETESQVVTPGSVSRKIKARGGRLMMVEVAFAAGGIGTEHDHPHEQATYCLEGRFVFHIGDDARTIAAGDTVYVKGGARHGVECLEAGRLLDVFSPQREDFLK